MAKKTKFKSLHLNDSLRHYIIDAVTVELHQAEIAKLKGRMRVAFDRRRHGENTAAKSDGHRETTTGVWVARGSFRRHSCRGRVATGARRDFCGEGEALFLAMESHRIRYAYQFPAIDFANGLTSVVRDPASHGRDYRCRRRGTTAMVTRAKRALR